MRRNTLAAALVLLTSCADLDDVERRSEPVIQGTAVDESVFPAAGALVMDGMFFCSGTLVTPTAVVTAAHCLDPMFIGPSVPGFTFVADARTVSPAAVHAGRETIPHPEFSFFTPDGQFHDIGVLLLAEAVVGIEPVPLASADDVAALAPGDSLELVGYGLTSPSGFEAGVKHHGVAALTSIDTFLYGIGTPGGVQNCNGDSGGPAFYEIAPGDYRVIGVVTGGPEPCSMGGYDIRVDAHLPWLQTVMGEITCDAPKMLCGAACVDTTIDVANCGACGRACLTDELCEAGRCVVTASPDAGAPIESDAGVALMPDGNLILDGGPGAPMDEGCSCRVGGRRRASPAWWLGLLGALVVFRRARRR